jgi:oligo-1,6-glucosidase
MKKQEQDWWRSAVVYQVYPQSFKDTTGTGKGDLNGITSKLQYLKDLGVEVVWLSPIYASPMVDMGYDISDYQAINPDFGTMEDWDRLLEEAHRIGLKVVMDLVVNHTSDHHAWFQDAMEGGTKKDWYVWRGKSEHGKEPNNWGAIFGGSCWEWSEKLQEYYLHVFDVSQPDLNWENPEVRNAIWDVMRFWLDKGCDGFRMDVINCISKTPGFPDAPVTDPDSEFQYGLIHRFNGPKVADYLREMHDQVLNHYPGTFTVGEAPGVSNAEQALPLVKDGKPLQVFTRQQSPLQMSRLILTHKSADALPLRTHVHRPPTRQNLL